MSETVGVKSQDQVQVKNEIESFLDSKEAGIKSAFSATKVNYALAQMYTVRGETCPVRVLEKNGETYLLNRAILDGNT